MGLLWVAFGLSWFLVGVGELTLAACSSTRAHIFSILSSDLLSLSTIFSSSNSVELLTGGGSTAAIVTSADWGGVETIGPKKLEVSLQESLQT